MTTAPTHTNLRDLDPNSYVTGTYSVMNPQVGKTRAGKDFLKCILRDATGEAAARKWTFAEDQLADVARTGFVNIAGHSQLYNGQVQIILEEIQGVEVTQEELASLLPTTSNDISAMEAELRGIMTSLEHPAMRALADAFLNDESLMQQFTHAPAAVMMHHAYLGGLLEHTLQLLKLAELTLPLYPKLNRDMVLLGLFLHDMAKVSELTWERGFDYTADGNLIGHLVRGAIWVQLKSIVAAKESGHRLPPNALRVLQHIILSHHEKPEFGAAKVPSTPEAIFVAHLDNLDAKMAMTLQAARPDDGGPEGRQFTDRIWGLDTRLFCPDPLADDGGDASSADG